MNTQLPPIANHTNISARGTKRAATSQLFLRLISSIDWGPNPPAPLRGQLTESAGGNVDSVSARFYFSFTSRTVQRSIETCISTCAPALGDVAD